MKRRLATSFVASAIAAGGIPGCGSSARHAPVTYGPPRTPGAITFRPLYCEIPAFASPADTQTPVGQAACAAADSAHLPTTPAADDQDASAVIVDAAPGSGLPSTLRYVLGPVDLNGTAVRSATVGTDGSGQFTVDLTLTPPGVDQFHHLALERYAYYQRGAAQVDPRSQEAIDVGGELVSAPTIQTTSFGDQVEISGSFTRAQATQLVASIGG